jgi:DNA-binding transcriptional ArsR family regulator
MVMKTPATTSKPRVSKLLAPFLGDGASKAGSTRRELLEKIRAQYRDPILREEISKAFDRVGVEELQDALNDISALQSSFVSQTLTLEYGEEGVKRVLEAYHARYASLGFSGTVAVDDCTKLQFSMALFGEGTPVLLGAPDSPVSALVVPAAGPPRIAPAIVRGSCRKLNGSILVTCAPDENGGKATLFLTAVSSWI